MSEESFSMRLLSLLCERAREELNMPEGVDKDVLIQALVEQCGLLPDEAHAICYSEPEALDYESIKRIAGVFWLVPELAACLLSPTSKEMVHHTLAQIDVEDMNTEDCDVCATLGMRLGEAEFDDSDEDLLELAYDLVEHLVFTEGQEDDEDFFDEELVAEATAMPPGMSGVMMQLDEEAKSRVLAYAYQELAASQAGKEMRQFRTYALLRNQHLPALAKNVMDLLCQADEHGMLAKDIVQALHLQDARALGQLERTVNSSITALSQAGHILHESPLLVERGKETVLKLTPQAQQAWIALVRADQSLLS